MSKIYQSYQREVEGRLAKAAKNFPNARNDYYNTSLSFLGDIPVPIQRKLFNQGYSFSHLPETDQVGIWLYIWENSRYFETLSQTQFFFCQKKNKLTWEDWKNLEKLAARIDNWAHSDTLSGLYAELHEKYPKKMYPIFLAWSKSQEAWLRRLSVVSLLYYSSARKTRIPPYQDLQKIVLTLLDDSHFYVQKGVGWTLREMYNVYPEQTFELLKKIAKQIPPAGWYAASEKLKATDKKLLMKIRKANR